MFLNLRSFGNSS